MKNTAKLSRCRHYRYALWRTWDEAKPRVMFIGLNPSTADETHDDPTLIRCMNFAKAWDYGGVCMTNLFAYRATDPKAMMAYATPVGSQNNKWLTTLAEEAGLVVAAWGNYGNFLNRAHKVKKLIPHLHCLKLNASGEPAHPLYQPAHMQPILLPV